MNFAAVMIEDMPSRSRRPTKFTPERIDQIRNLVERGKSREEIAEIVGCTAGTLAVMCSKLGVSLRRPRFNMLGTKPAKPKPISASEPCQSDDPPAPPIVPTNHDHHPSSAPTPRKADPAPPAFTIVMSYHGMERRTDLMLSDVEIGQLAIEADIRGMRIGELLATIITKVVERQMFDIVERKP